MLQPEHVRKLNDRIPYNDSKRTDRGRNNVSRKTDSIVASRLYFYRRTSSSSSQKELDDNYVDYNEQDLKDAWGIKENSEEENIGIKRRITDKGEKN